MTRTRAGRVLVVGSVNVDLVAAVARLPERGETVAGATFAQHDGGKGGNQAVAAARLGVVTQFVGAVGDDSFGERAVAALREAGVGVADVARRIAIATGVALILVEAGGENVIAVAAGANATFAPAEAEAALEHASIGARDVLLVSHEIPTATVRTALLAGRRAGATTVLSPAPAAGLDRSVLGLADIVTPNRSELIVLARAEARRTGRSDPGGDAPEDQARLLLATSAEGAGPSDAIVVTLGAAGALLVPRGGGPTVEVPAPRVAAVDSTGAGDAFAGALAAGLAEGRDLADAVTRAVAAASLSTTRVGARSAMPTAAQLDAFLRPSPDAS